MKHEKASKLMLIPVPGKPIRTQGEVPFKESWQLVYDTDLKRDVWYHINCSTSADPDECRCMRCGAEGPDCWPND